MWKPGQLLWYNKKRYRVTRAGKYKLCCMLCSHRNSGMKPCGKLCGEKMPFNCYPKLDMPKLKRSE